MTEPAWQEWFEFEDHAVVIGGKRLPAIFTHYFLNPKPEDGMFGVAYVPIESGLYVSFFADRDATYTENVTAQVVDYAENKVLDASEWELCPHEDGDPRHYRRCRVGPAGVNYLTVDLLPSNRLTRQECRNPEDAFEYLRWASTIYIDPEGAT